MITPQIQFIILFELKLNNFNTICYNIIMLEKKISKPSQNGDEKKDDEVVEMLEI